jgi:hypothetical protein
VILVMTTFLALIEFRGSSAIADGVTVMTQNVYAGFDIFRVFAECEATPEACPLIVNEAYEIVLANDFAARAEAIALEVQQKRPHIIGVQELVLWRSGPHTPGGPPDATIVESDYFATLLEALHGKGLNYEAIILSQAGGDRELKREVGVDDNGNPVFEDIRQTGFATILARTDLPPSQFQVSNPLSGNYALDSIRAWQSVDVMADGLSFRLISTQLGRNSVNPSLAIELLDPEGPAGTELPTIVLGDFNLDVDNALTAYEVLLNGGFTDPWTMLHPGEPGFTCCQAEVLTNDPSMLSGRFDVVLSRNGLVALDAEIVGEELADRTPSGLWPSDHAGIVVTFGPQAPLLPGDHNQDGTVDAADYVVWRKNPDAFGGGAGYSAWRTNFGRLAGSGSSATGSANSAVPEPATLLLGGVAMSLWLGVAVPRKR